MPTEILPVSAVVATRNRVASLRETLESLAHQKSQPAEIVVVDASDDEKTKTLCEAGVARLQSQISWVKAPQAGAAAQRNEGVKVYREYFIWFLDDDVVLEPNCTRTLWDALQSSTDIGGVNAMIVNQSYHPPGIVSRSVFRLLHGRDEDSFAGRVIGPAVNLLPEDNGDLPEVVPVEWLNTTCTMYRREALPAPVFDSFFTDYSLMEDLALSLRVAQRGWRLCNARKARIVHNSKGGAHKADPAALAAMELRNRRYVMNEILGRRSATDYVRLLLWESFTVASSLANPAGRRNLSRVLAGKMRALRGTS